MAAWDLDFLPSRARASFSSSFSLPPRRQEPGTRTSSKTTSPVWEARMPIFWNFWPAAEAGGAGRDDEGGLAPGAELGLDRGDDDVHVGDAAVGDPGLGAVDDPLVLGLVVDGPGAEGGDVGAGVGLGDAEGGRLELLRGAEALGAPLHELFGGAVGGDPGQAQRASRRWPG